MHNPKNTCHRYMAQAAALGIVGILLASAHQPAAYAQATAQSGNNQQNAAPQAETRPMPGAANQG